MNMKEYPDALPVNTGLLVEKDYPKGRYRIENILGRGGFGITYKAWDNCDNSYVAIKEYYPTDLAFRLQNSTSIASFNSECSEYFLYGRQQFLDEAKRLHRFRNNPNVVSVKQFFTQNGTAYIVMDYVDGISLDRYVAEHGGKIDWQEACRILLPVMKTLEEVHDAGVIHRDIAPDNIYINRSGNPILLDFGAAKNNLLNKSQSINFVIKDGFSPVEQYSRSLKGQGPYTDVYATAATFYYLITGKKPMSSLERLASGAQKESSGFPSPSALGVEYPAAMEKALMKGMSVKAEDRYQTMAEFRRAMEDGFPKGIVPVPWWKRTKVICGSVCAAVLITALIVILSFTFGKKTNSLLKEDVFDKQTEDKKYDLESAKEHSVFGSNYKRKNIIKVTFLSRTAGRKDDSWDVSVDQDNSVQAWVEDEGGFKHLYIGADGGMTAPSNLQGLFEGYVNLQKIEWNDAVDMKNVENMKAMFYGCEKLETLDLSIFSTAVPTTMRHMLYNCSSLRSVNLNGINTSMVSDMKCLFSGCSRLKDLDLSGMNTENAEIMDSMFDGCASIERIVFGEDFSTSKAKQLNGMFEDCSSLTELDLSVFDLSNAENTKWMFNRCSSLKLLKIDNFNLSNAEETWRMFAGCSSLETLTIKSPVHLGGEMFEGCTQLKELHFMADALSFGEDIFKNCSNLKIFYPAGDKSWNEALNNSYGGTVEWIFSAENGDSAAQYALGIEYYYGNNVEQDYTEAMKWFLMAASAGHAQAKTYVGSMFYYGMGVDKDLTEAFSWYLQAAEQGESTAQYDVGLLYEYGKGVEKDLDKAIEWYTKSADQGNEDAKKALEKLQPENSGVSPSVRNSATGFFQGKWAA